MRIFSLDTLIKRPLKAGCPQSLQVSCKGPRGINIQKKYGKAFRYFDLASLTKVLVTVPLAMRAYELSELNLEKSVGHYLGFLRGSISRIPIINLLRHHSGLVWWRPYYEQLLKYPPQERVTRLKMIFRDEKVMRRSRCVYSDPDFILLGWVLEKIFGSPLDFVANEQIFIPAGAHNTFFVRETFPGSLSQVAPTGYTRCSGQHRRVIRGRVHDDNAWGMGGVSGHAGLFSTLEDTTHLADLMLHNALGTGDFFASTQTFRFFSKRAVSPRIGDWALGFTVPSRPVSTGGMLVSDSAFGHTGFTGTSLWIDLKRKALVVVLSNRTYLRTYPDIHAGLPDIEFQVLRRQIHDTLWTFLDASKR